MAAWRDFIILIYQSSSACRLSVVRAGRPWHRREGGTVPPVPKIGGMAPRNIVPQYRLLADHLLQRIRSGELPPGSLLPTEQADRKSVV